MSRLRNALILGKALYDMRNLPKEVMSFLDDKKYINVVVSSETQVFKYVDFWLSTRVSQTKTRNFTVAQLWSDDGEDWKYVMSPGEGRHVIHYKGQPVLIKREDVERGNFFTETITLSATNKEILQELIEEARSIHEVKDSIKISFWKNSGYSLLDHKAKRPLSSLFMNKNTGQRIVDDAQKFMNNRAWYDDRSLPYRRGYLLEGPPGTGKTTFIFVLAGIMNKSVNIINLSTVKDDNDLQSAFNEAENNFVVIEDIDEGRSEKITDSGIINAVDGIASRDGRILFITSNNPEVINPKLLRPGRIDMRVGFEPLEEEAARAMYERFFPGGDKFDKEIKPKLPLTGAALQNKLLGMK